MNVAETIEQIRRARIVPVVRAHSADEAEKTIKNLIAAGLEAIEITLTTPDAIDLIEKYAAAEGRPPLIGAGTVVDAKSAKKCFAAGAKFIVSPIFAPEIIEFCRENAVTVISGAFTPTEIFTAWRAGADFVKVFPAHAAGGAVYIKSVKAVFPEVRLMPTGGINLDDAALYFEAGADAVGIGSGLAALTSAKIEKALDAFS